eukprot:TRINITY_DN4968_c0_g1_i1.p2 TRINITY_DN4968_c0_g1~~TRINITY_DN4968_c0_g1_i1.p2  ORF type:complete len:177 (+),score=78.80 TRINITY_DN4968_c0_g1_i1:119-649(+)
MSTFEFMQRLFPPGSVSPDISKEEFSKEFERRLEKLENSGFLEENGLPKIEGEDELARKLAYHKQRQELVVIKYWKRGCIPCLSKAEMFKEVERWMLAEKPQSVFYSIDIRHPLNRDLADRQLVDGTPSIQKYWGGRQVGGEVRVNDQPSLMKNIMTTVAQCMENSCPRSPDPEYQ